MKLKENSFLTSVVLLPFILLLGILKIKGVLVNSIYGYLLIIMMIIFSISFIFSLFFAIDEIMNSDNNKRIIMLMFLPFIYLPIYYTKYVYKNEKAIGYCVSLANIMLIISLFFVTRTFVLDYTMDVFHKNFKLVDHYNYVAKNNLFSISINNQYVCNNTLGDYVVACDNKEDDSFIGIYSYEKESFSDGELDDILAFHQEQTINYIQEKNYQVKIIDNNDSDLVQINYYNMAVLIKRLVYYDNDKMYCLIVIKEVLKDNVDIVDFDKNIEKIEFLV